MKKIIDTIELPCGLRTCSRKELEVISEELRNELIDIISGCGGHFASSLGVTELSVVLHHAFDTPNDKLVWDVGHQAYVHKLITGRRHKLKNMRTLGGISGFLKRAESPYDIFGAGHAGTSISAATGIRVALDRAKSKNYVVSVIGDASIASGMALEAMNHAGSLELKRFIVVLNDNKMSISPNVGALSRLFSKAVTCHTSTLARRGIKRLYEKGYVPEIVYKAMDRAEEVTQGFFASVAMLFEAFGFRYIGPIDGHNIEQLVEALERAKEQDGPVLVHAVTIKGKGYEPAEEDPVKWHGVIPFDRKKAEFKSGDKKFPSYTAVFSDTVLQICESDPSVVAITAAMAGGTGLDKLQSLIPESFFDVGICEQHAVTFAAGLASQGQRPICAIYSTFLQRAYDQIVHDVCIQNLPVFFAIDRGGVVGGDGETHQGVFDVSYLRSLPNMVIMSPKDENEFRHMIFTAVYHDGPVALRYPRGTSVGVSMDKGLRTIDIGRGEVIEKGEDLLLICFGPMTQVGLEVARRVLEEYGITTTVINARFAKPLDERLLIREIPRHLLVCTIEDHAIQGGFGSAILEMVNKFGLDLQNPIRCFGVKDDFVPHATQEQQYEMNEYDTKSIIRSISGFFAVVRRAEISMASVV